MCYKKCTKRIWTAPAVKGLMLLESTLCDSAICLHLYAALQKKAVLLGLFDLQLKHVKMVDLQYHHYELSTVFEHLDGLSTISVLKLYNIVIYDSII